LIYNQYQSLLLFGVKVNKKDLKGFLKVVVSETQLLISLFLLPKNMKLKKMQPKLVLTTENTGQQETLNQLIKDLESKDPKIKSPKIKKNV
jgi:hypothetical protein